MNQLTDSEKRRAVAQITEQAITETPVSTSVDGWIFTLRQFDCTIACQFQFEDCLKNSHLWFENGEYRAANLPSGLEDSEGCGLDRVEAAALLDGGVRHRPVDLKKIEDSR